MFNNFFISFFLKATTNNVNQRTGGPSGFIQVRQNLLANNANTIDLTDEDDPKPKILAQNNPPALVALNMRNRQNLVSQALQRGQLATTTTTTTPRATPAQARMQRQIRKLWKKMTKLYCI